MRKSHITKTILNGFIRTVLSIIYYAIDRFTESNENEDKRLSGGKQRRSGCYSSSSSISSGFSSWSSSSDESSLNVLEDVKRVKSESKSKSVKHHSMSNFSSETSISSDDDLDKRKRKSSESSSWSSSSASLRELKKQHNVKFVRASSSSTQLIVHNKSSARVKTAILFFLIILAYICLNNYLIMFFYYKSYSVQSSLNKVSNTTSGWNSLWLAFSLKPFVFMLGEYEVKKQKKPSLSGISDDAWLSTTPLGLNQTDWTLFDSNLTMFIDPQDIDIPGLELNDLKLMQQKMPDKFVLLDDEYFEQDHQPSGELKSSRVERRSCVHAKLNPYDSQIMQFVKRETELRCNPKRNWVYVENGTIRVAKAALKKHGAIVCAYVPLYRGNNDFSIYEGNRIFPVMDKMPLITDFFKIDCRSKDGAVYSNIHSGIAYESSLHMRHRWNPMPRKALGYNVLMFGFDSVSRMSWIRMLPKSYSYMIKLGFVVLKGYNIVGDGTPQALLPILTGHRETELPEARRGFRNATFVDQFPWIWKDYKRAGYVTQWAEDMQSIGTFQLRMMGFRKQPVDHYMRVFYLEAERYYNRFRRLCLGSISRHQNMFNWVKEFFQMYDKKPKFSFIFHSEASHNYNNPLSLLDDDLLAYLKYLKKSGIMDNTVLLFMSDHGVRVSDLRQYSQGKLEERLPFFSVRMPSSFQQKYPNEMRNLRLNSRRLTTPFDIHETLKHLLNFSPVHGDQAQRDRTRRGISLFKSISPYRSCHDAQIEAHWCSCLNWINLNITSSVNKSDSWPMVIDKLENEIKDEDENSTTVQSVELTNSTESVAIYQRKRVEVDYTQYERIKQALVQYKISTLKVAYKAVEYINSLLAEVRSDCEPVRLHSVQKLAKLELNHELLTFKQSKDIHGREAVFEDVSDVENDDDLFVKPLNISPLNLITISNHSTTSNTTNLTELTANRTLTAEAVFQITLTTWPGQASYELSFKYNRYNGSFSFSKNEISRINNYNGTSSCMLSKRPDLRQYCFCKYEAVLNNGASSGIESVSLVDKQPN